VWLPALIIILHACDDNALIGRIRTASKFVYSHDVILGMLGDEQLGSRVLLDDPDAFVLDVYP
jgi:hypothetical protein